MNTPATKHTPTPRTDAEARWWGDAENALMDLHDAGKDSDWVTAEFARILENENTALVAALELVDSSLAKVIIPS